MMNRPEHFVFLLVGAFSQLAFANAIEPLRIANRMSGQPLYRWSLMAEGGKIATASNGTRMLVDFGLDQRPICDRLFVVTGNEIQGEVTATLLSVLRRARADGIPLGTFCSGAYVFARAGFLKDRRVAMHWEFHPGFSEEFPEVLLESGVFAEDGPFLTASGGYAAADLMLHLINRRHGPDLAQIVSDQMVYATVREGTARQRVSLQARAGIRNRHLALALGIMESRLDETVAIAEIAAAVGLSTRQLERLFRQYLQTTPNRHFRQMRMDRSRHLLLQTEMSVLEIALACGFANSDHFTRVYRQTFGVVPTRQRGQMS